MNQITYQIKKCFKLQIDDIFMFVFHVYLKVNNLSVFDMAG